MPITISDVVLRSGLQWTDRWGSQEVSQKVIRSIGGNPIFYHARLNGAMKITLESIDDSGIQTYETVQALRALAAVPGAQYLLDFGTEQFSVMFRHEDAPAFDARPVIPRTIAVAGDYFFITMKLITV